LKKINVTFFYFFLRYVATTMLKDDTNQETSHDLTCDTDLIH